MSDVAPPPPEQMQNGHCGKGLDTGAVSPTAQRRHQLTGGEDRRVLPNMTPDANGEVFGDPDEGRARRHAESLSAQAQADADELLSAAHVHAELLRVHAEAARAEAECVRAEAAALRRAAREEAAAAASRAEALIARVQATAEEFRSAMEDQADAARTEVERLGTEAASLRRRLQAEMDAGLANTEQLRAEVQTLWAETRRGAAELRLLSARSGAVAGPDGHSVGTGGGRTDGAPDHQSEGGEHGHVIGQNGRGLAASPDGPGDDFSRGEADRQAAGSVAELRRQANGRLDRLQGDMAVEVEPRTPDMIRTPGDNHRGPDPVLPQLDVAKLLREIWDAAYMESTRLSARGFPGESATPTTDASPNSAGQASTRDLPVGGQPDRPKASEPLIGSGGWRRSPASTLPGAPVESSVDGDPVSPSSGREWDQLEPEEWSWEPSPEARVPSPPGPGRHGRSFRRRR